MDDLSPAFVSHAAGILGDTNNGLTGSQIVSLTSAYAADHNVNIPHPRYPYEASNKQSALTDNVLAFSPKLRYRILKELCDHPRVKERPEVRSLKLTLFTRYGGLYEDGELAEDISATLIEQTRHWLDPYPDVLELYNAALEKHSHGLFQRNVLDDLRLSLEKLLQHVFGNGKSLENQISSFGSFIQGRGGSPQLGNMFQKLIDYYTKYQNTYVKHDDAVIEQEVEFLIEITSSFMKHIIRMQNGH